MKGWQGRPVGVDMTIRWMRAMAGVVHTVTTIPHVHDCGTGDVLRESANVDLARGPYVWDRPSQQPSPMPIPTPSA